jgi:hypothetical protein
MQGVRCINMLGLDAQQGNEADKARARGFAGGSPRWRAASSFIESRCAAYCRCWTDASADQSFEREDGYEDGTCVGLVMVLPLGAGAQAGPGAASDPGREAIMILRVVNTVQAELRHPAGEDIPH